ncbi:MAG: head GIN domain-containing protein [Spartobacteria bacterium]
MNRLALFTLSALTIFLSACDWAGIRGNGHIVTQQRPIGDFTEVTASGSFEIEWHPGAPGLSVTGDENLLGYIDNQLSGNTLKFDTKERIWWSHKIKVAVSSAALRGVKLTGACKLSANHLAGPKFYLQSSGASKMSLEGQVDELLVDMSGASKLEAAGLRTKTAEISGSGASKVDITASEAVRVSISGAGKVTYGGNPPTVEKHISGAGSVRPRDQSSD